MMRRALIVLCIACLTFVVAPYARADSGDAHPSGNDRSVESGASGTQGRSTSTPDQNLTGPERTGQTSDHSPSSTSDDGTEDKDRNNGCGNDDDFEDDNEGHCYGNAYTRSINGEKPSGGNGSHTTSGSGNDPGSAGVLPGGIGGAPSGTGTIGGGLLPAGGGSGSLGAGAVVAGRSVNASGTAVTSVLGTRFARNAAGAASLGALPFTGVGSSWLLRGTGCLLLFFAMLLAVAMRRGRRVGATIP